jgi:hypothetical protein
MLEYPNLKVPKDAYSILPEHLEKVRGAAGDVVVRLNDLLDGRVIKDKWHTSDRVTLIFPAGAKWTDVPGPPSGSAPLFTLRGGVTEKH